MSTVWTYFCYMLLNVTNAIKYLLLLKFKAKIIRRSMTQQRYSLLFYLYVRISNRKAIIREIPVQHLSKIGNRNLSKDESLK